MPAIPARLRVSPELHAQVIDAIQQGNAIVCLNRCLWCGRVTPHEVCHKHSRAIHGPAAVEYVWEDGDEATWSGFNEPEEECTDPDCPQRKADWQ